uniref:protein-glutamate O-methyltransferase n=1 Tax=Dechloromonas aromatica (strain RCB) TaxID=159087 RepID=Q47EE1_DECAR
MPSQGKHEQALLPSSALAEDKYFPIVGIGTSAGGLEALEQFLGGVPVNCGMAFVVVQHLDPNRYGMLPELLQRSTPMVVKQAGNRMKIKPDCVYVIPPNKDLSILHDTLYLLDPVAARGLRLPINSFLCSLAEDRRERAIGIILSGMGSDGTQGLLAISEHGGLSVVQDPTTAKFDAMPRSAIDARLADIVAPPGDLARRIIDRLHHPPRLLPPETFLVPDSEAKSSAFEKICILLRAQTGHDFSLYKKSTIYRRVERRMGIHRLGGIADYVGFLQTNPQEVDLLFKELLIGVTSFFRDPAAWAYLQEQVLPGMILAKTHDNLLRAWVAGCSSGEEAYTLAMIFGEAMDHAKPTNRIELQIFATDLDPDAIAKARQGIYPSSIAGDVSPERLARFFVEENGRFRICQEIRQMVVFAPHNVTMDPPFTRLDILTCRNVLIYLGADLQKRLLPLFHYSLKPGGTLFLGSAESIGNFAELFSPLEPKARIYRREEVNQRAIDVDFPTRYLGDSPNPALIPSPTMQPANLQTLADQLLLQKFSPAAVLTNADGDILFISGRTGKYLEPAAGKANWNIHAMAHEGLRQELILALPKALRIGEAVVVKDLTIEDGSERQSLDLTVYPIDEPAPLHGMAMIVFADVVAAKPAPKRHSRKQLVDARVAELEQALLQAREELQSIREEMQTSHEELKSANEELQSTNEELQSTNEELTTSKEEMQSLNEELQTVNAELQSKVDEWSATSNDMKNLLNSTDIATVFLDNMLHVRRFTRQATHIFKFIPSDIGRPLADIVHKLDYTDLQDDAQEVLRTLAFCEKQITSNDGCWYIVRIMPYRTLENVIDGVVITFIDISEAKRLEAELRAARTALPGNR